MSQLSNKQMVEIAEDRHWWFASRTRALLTLLNKYISPNGAARQVLDVGSGAGNMMHHLGRYGAVIGLENNPKPIAVAHQRGYDVREGIAEEMPFAHATFELVAALDVLEHCPDDRAILRECNRVLKSEGYIIVTVPALQWLWSHNDVINKHYRRYTTAQLSAVLRETGFKVRHITYNNFFIFPLAAAMILARRGGATPDLATPDDEAAYQVEMEPTHPVINAVLTIVGQVESLVLRFVPLPIGVGIICIAQKRD